MKLDDILKSITAFLLDIISAVIPGLIFWVGLNIINEGILCKLQMKDIAGDSALVWICLAISFATGHILLQLHMFWITKVYPKNKSLGDIEERKSYRLFAMLINQKIQNHPGFPEEEKTVWGVHDLRNVALTVSSEGAELGRRFMAISLLCSGMCAALHLLALDFLVTRGWNAGLSVFKDPVTYLFILPVLAGLLCSQRAKEFNRRSLTTPFGTAFTDLLMEKQKEGKVEKSNKKEE